MQKLFNPFCYLENKPFFIFTLLVIILIIIITAFLVVKETKNK